MKQRIIALIIILLGVATTAEIVAAEPVTTRKERNLILDANKAFEKKDYQKAIELYNMALEINPQSERARYNLAVAMVKRADEIGGAAGNPGNPDPTTMTAADSVSIGLKHNANKIFTELYSGGSDKLTRENSIYNSGNLFFSEQEYANSIEQYKKALRLNPDNENARHNLRVAQLRLQQQQQQQQNQQQQDKKDQEQEKKEQEKKEQEQQEQEQNKDQQPQQQQPQPQPQPQQPQQQPKSNYDNILNAAQQNEAKTRERLEKKQVPVSPRHHTKPW